MIRFHGITVQCAYIVLRTVRTVLFEEARRVVLLPRTSDAHTYHIRDQRATYSTNLDAYEYTVRTE
jgi:hypothetical protein